MNYTKRTDLYLTIVPLLTLVGTVVQTILLLNYYDPALLLYDRGTPAYLIPVAMLVILILSATVFFTLPGGKLQIAPKPSVENRGSADTPARGVDLAAILLKIGALLLLIGAVLSGILLFYGDFPVDHARDLWQSAANGSADSSVNMAGTLLQYSAYVGILAAVFPAVLLIVGKGSPIAALADVIWLIMMDLSIYFDNSTVLNDPCRSLEILGLSTAILWLLIEVKRMLGKAGRRAYTFLSLTAFGILCITAIPRLIATASGQLDFTSRTLIPVAMLGIAVMIAGRLFSLRNLPATVPDPEPEANNEDLVATEPEAPPALPDETEEIGDVAFVTEASPDTLEAKTPRAFADPFEVMENIVPAGPEAPAKTDDADTVDSTDADEEDTSR